MICKRCKSATAIISLPSHNTGFCENCFRDFFSAQVVRGIETGKLFTWKRHEHCLVLVGYDKDYYYMNDPYQSKGLVAYKRSVVEARYATMGSQAVVIQ